MRNALLGLILLQSVVLIPMHPARAQSSAPQFVAKLYTEVLGRAPDSGGFDYWTNRIRASNCSTGTLQDAARFFYIQAPEYQNLSKNYDNANRLVTLYRGIFSREPDQEGFDYWRNQLDSGVPFAIVMNAFLNSSEFLGIATKACNPTRPDYGFGTKLYPSTTTAGKVLPYRKPVEYYGIGKTRVYTSEEVQALLSRQIDFSNLTNNYLVTELEPNSVVKVTKTLHLSIDRTLRTKGSPSLQNYAKMARFVRASNFSGPLIQTSPRSKLEYIWVDGGRGSSSENDVMEQQNINISLGGTGDHIRTENSAGITAVMAVGNNNGGIRCNSSSIFTNNLITAYSSSYFPTAPGKPSHTDGLTSFCTDLKINNNQFVDLTDGAIILFHGHPASGDYTNMAQKSLVTQNVVVNAGNSAYWGIGFEPYKDLDPSFPYPRMFDGGKIDSNFIKTSDMAHIITPLFAGTFSLWANPDLTQPSNAVMGTCSTPPSGEFRGNSFGPSPCYITNNTFTGRAAIAIGLHGMTGVQISGNAIDLKTPPQSLITHPGFTCTRSASSYNPVVCAPGSTVCPPGGVIAQIYRGCYVSR